MALAGAKQRSVLAILALEANRLVSTDLLLDQIWGDGAGRGARRSLQVYVSNLRKILGDGARIESQRDGYVLEIEPEQLDLHRFARLVGAGRTARGQGALELAAALLREALDLWRGPPLADFTYEPFASAHIERLQQERLAVLEDRIEADLELGRHAQVVPELGDLVADNPLRERLRAQLMLALYRCDRQAEALNACKKGRELLAEQLGIEPALELQELERAILDHDTALDAPTFVPVIDRLAEDSGSFRLTERPTASSNLPAQLTSFVGRERELAEIGRLLGSSRLVTLSGPGGSGKTRLALHVAGEVLHRFREGVWLADLSPLADAALVATTVASALGVREDAGRSMIDALIDAVRDRNLLVVIDNCEHVIDTVAKVADALLRSCPAVELLATSREPLGISGEHVYRVPSLHVPDADEADLNVLVASDAVRLFAERVAQHKAGYALDSVNAPTIARVCRRLDGIPLAIELGAAKLRSISLDEIETRLDQRFRLLTGGVRTALPRQQTLQALIDWSWDLLTKAEQLVLARLGVFAGSWDLEAAEVVACGAGIEAWEVLDLLGALVDKSLVQTDDTSGTVRYRLLETVRDYSNAKLAERGEDEPRATKARHRSHYLVLAESAAPHLISDGQTEWLDRLELDHDNFRTALAYSLIDSDPEPGMRLAIALQWFWQFRVPAVEGAEILTLLLDRPDTQTPTVMRGRALAVLAALLIESSNARAGSSRGDELLAISRAQGDRNLEAQALTVLSWACFRLGNFVDALALADEGLAAARLVGDIDLTTRLLNARGIVLGLRGENSGARACFQEARDLCRQTGNGIRVTALLNNRGYFALAAGELDAARADLSEALSIALASHDPVSANACCNLGLVECVDGNLIAARSLFTQALSTARHSGDQNQAAFDIFGLALTTADPEHAAMIHGAADALFDQQGDSYEPVEAELREADHTRIREQLGADAFDAAYQTGRNLRRDEAIALALQ